MGTVRHMALARFKALCIDANDPEKMARFWAPALGLPVAEPVPTGFKITGTRPEQTVWVNAVPEEKTVKQRVHFDLHGSGIDDYPGAKPLSDEGEFRWRVMEDPEGGEFCVFVRDQVPEQKLYEVVVDSADHKAQARWWHDVLGGRLDHSDEGWSWIEHVPGMPFECLVFATVPEPKTVKNRLHWDVYGDVQAFLDRGATKLWEMPRWTVLADPEGNEFCVFAPR